MVIFSIFMGIPTNLGWFTLYGDEISGPLTMLRENTFPVYRIPLWILLLLSHLCVISLTLLTKNRNFNKLLFWFPLVFILLFMAFNFFAIIYLIPFIILWIITMIKAKKVNFK